MSEKPTNTSTDEIDLGQLFQLIGNGFQKLFNFIGSIFKALFNLLIMLLVFLQKNAFLLGLSLVTGGVVGFLADTYKTPKFISKMVVEPNFNSVQQLYNNIEFYNDLAKAQDSVALSNALSISVTDAATIREFLVDSNSDENQKIKMFDNFVRGLDTTTVKAMDYEKYLENFNSMDARFHEISMIGTDNKVAKKIQPAIISSIVANAYFKLQKKVNDENLALQDSIYNRQLVELDSLQQLYKNVMVKEADKPMPGTNINMADNGAMQNKELALVHERDGIKSKLVVLNKERANTAEILNVISDFPARGVKVKGFWNNYKFLFPVVIVVAVVIILSILQLNKFLGEYRKMDNRS